MAGLKSYLGMKEAQVTTIMSSYDCNGSTFTSLHLFLKHTLFYFVAGWLTLAERLLDRKQDDACVGAKETSGLAKALLAF
jgi:hypothetical protein